MSVYFILCDSIPEPIVKIGKSTNIKQRVQSISTSTPFDVRLIALCEDIEEKELHNKFNHLRYKNEWFSFTEEIKEFIKPYEIKIEKRIKKIVEKVEKSEKPQKITVIKQPKAKKEYINPWHFSITFIDCYLIKKYENFKFCKKVGKYANLDLFNGECWINLIELKTLLVYIAFKLTDNARKANNLATFAIGRISIEIESRIDGTETRNPKVNYCIPEMKAICEELLK